MKYCYETHLHTSPASRCARVSVREALDFYRLLGYAGVFITNHYIEPESKMGQGKSYAERTELFFADYEEGLRIGKEFGLSVFCGVEITYGGSDFLVYGLDKSWYLSHPELETLKHSEKLKLLTESGALVIHAHPFRESWYIDHIRLFPRAVDGVEVVNACRTEFENRMAREYADNYGLLHFAGSDNHHGIGQKLLAGIEMTAPIADDRDFVDRIRRGEYTCFTRQNPCLPKDV
ncbi:MAG: histidinol phosphatase [Ruminococcaceae bacterium]|nr:histidinol phosphatase [Oscillospiraceae bacterium]